MRIIHARRGIAAAALAVAVFSGIGVTTAMAAGAVVSVNCTGYDVVGGTPDAPYSVTVGGQTVVSGKLGPDGYTAGTLVHLDPKGVVTVTADGVSKSVTCGDPDPDPTPEPTTPKPDPTSATPTPTPPVVTDPPSPSPTVTPTITATSTPKPTATKTAEPRPRPTSTAKPPTKPKSSVAPPTRRSSATHDSSQPSAATKKSRPKNSGKLPRRDNPAAVPAVPNTGLD